MNIDLQHLSAQRRQVAFQVVRVTLWVVVAGICSGLLFFLFSDAPPGADLHAREVRFRMSALIPLGAAIGLALLRRGLLVPAVALLALILYAVPMVAAIVVGLGVHSIGMMLWAIVVMLFGFVWGNLAAVGVTLVFVANIIGLMLAQMGGALPGPTLSTLGGPIFFGLTLLLLVVLVCWLTVSYSGIFSAALEAAARTRQELAANERQLQAIIEAEPECVKVLGPDGGLRQMNRAGLDMIEADSIDQVLGMNLGRIVAPQHREAFAALNERVSRGESGVLEFEIIGLKGGHRWLETHAVAMRDDDDRITGLLGVTRDITERRNTDAALRASEEKLRDLYELSPLGIALTDMQGRFIEFNEAFRHICGYSAEELKTLDYWALTPKKYASNEAEQLESLERSGRYGPYEKEYVRKDGSMVPLQLSGVIVTGRDGKRHIWSIVEDITKRRQIEKAMVESEQRMELALAGADLGMWDLDIRTGEFTYSPRLISMLGLATGELAVNARNVMSLLHADDAPRFSSNYYAHLKGKTPIFEAEYRIRHKDGRWIWILTRGAVVERNEDGRAVRITGTNLDITERKEAENKIRNLAFYDALTGLPNRRLLVDRLKQAVASGARTGRHGALLFIDLDNFKTINDTLGHDIGDLLLQQVGQRLAYCVREGDSVARLGGDEFVVMLEDLSDNAQEAATQTETVGEKILATLNKPYQLASYAHHSTPSIGVTLFADHQGTTDDLLKRADLAMYQAKAAGRNTLRFFDPEMQAVVTARAALEAGLRGAFLHNQFLLYYQGQFDGGGCLTGVEALLRWQHPQRGLVPPLEFIPLAEDTGLILPIGLWVLETACEQLAFWAKRPQTAHLTVAVNVSAHQFHQPDFVGQVLAALDCNNVDAGRLKLELTESMLVTNMEDIIAKMTELKAQGVGFSLDDFGTGYSSLSYLKRLPLDQLKIDQGFVRDILTDPNDAAIAKTVIALAESFGLAVIAEGVETEAQRDFLARQGCHAYQGYLYGRPLPLEEFEKLSQRADTHG